MKITFPMLDSSLIAFFWLLLLLLLLENSSDRLSAGTLRCRHNTGTCSDTELSLLLRL